jgi:hypothetical protein
MRRFLPLPALKLGAYDHAVEPPHTPRPTTTPTALLIAEARALRRRAAKARAEIRREVSMSRRLRQLLARRRRECG